jgi:hypothetical protein
MKRSLVLFLRLFLPLAALSAGLGLLFSRWYWGYWLTPPPVPEVVNRFETVRSVTPLGSVVATDPLTLAVASGWDCDRTSRQSIAGGDYCASSRCNTEFCDSYRLLLALGDRDLLQPNLPAIAPSQLPAIETAILNSASWQAAKPGYEDMAKQVSGLVVEAADSQGVQYVAIALNGGQIANDTYPFYEFVFRRSEGGSLEWVAGQHFFYEIAGLEGMTGGVVFRVLLFLSAVLSLATAGFYQVSKMSDR